MRSQIQMWALVFENGLLWNAGEGENYFEGWIFGIVDDQKSFLKLTKFLTPLKKKNNNGWTNKLMRLICINNHALHGNKRKKILKGTNPRQYVTLDAFGSFKLLTMEGKKLYKRRSNIVNINMHENSNLKRETNGVSEGIHLEINYASSQSWSSDTVYTQGFYG